MWAVVILWWRMAERPLPVSIVVILRRPTGRKPPMNGGLGGRASTRTTHLRVPGVNEARPERAGLNEPTHPPGGLAIITAPCRGAQSNQAPQRKRACAGAARHNRREVLEIFCCTLCSAKRRYAPRILVTVNTPTCEP